MITNADCLPAIVLKRKAVVYACQSTQAQAQVQGNLESQRRQYDLVNEARHRGFYGIEVIEDNRAHSARSRVVRRIFTRFVSWLYAREVGTVLCMKDSRFACNWRDGHQSDVPGIATQRAIDMHRYHPRSKVSRGRCVRMLLCHAQLHYRSKTPPPSQQWQPRRRSN